VSNVEKYTDEFGLVGPLPATDGQRVVPPEGCNTGPEVGELLPDFPPPPPPGGRVRLHEDRNNSKAAVVFLRSAVW